MQLYLNVKQSYSKRNKEVHEDAWSYGAIYWPDPNFIKSRVYYAHALILLLL